MVVDRGCRSCVPNVGQADSILRLAVRKGEFRIEGMDAFISTTRLPIKVAWQNKRACMKSSRETIHQSNDPFINRTVSFCCLVGVWLMNSGREGGRGEVELEGSWLACPWEHSSWHFPAAPVSVSNSGVQTVQNKNA
jgi:hypothetical protein